MTKLEIASESCVMSSNPGPVVVGMMDVPLNECLLLKEARAKRKEGNGVFEHEESE